MRARSFLGCSRLTAHRESKDSFWLAVMVRRLDRVRKVPTERRSLVITTLQSTTLASYTFTNTQARQLSPVPGRTISPVETEVMLPHRAGLVVPGTVVLLRLMWMAWRTSLTTDPAALGKR